MGHDQITPEWIEKMRKVCNAATPGPWESKHYGRYEDHDECCIALTDDSIEPSKYENADFIAAARTDLPAALDALEASMLREAEKDATIASYSAAFEDVKQSLCCGGINELRAACSEMWRVLDQNAPTGAESDGEHA